MEKIDLVEYVNKNGHLYEDETRKIMKEVCGLSVNLDHIKVPLEFDQNLLVKYENQYLPMWRSRLLNLVYDKVTRRSVVVDSNDCISLVQLLMRGNSGFLEIFMRSCDVKGKLVYDVINISKFRGEIIDFYKLNDCRCIIHFGSLHYFFKEDF
jgi:hypothetical protein